FSRCPQEPSRGPPSPAAPLLPSPAAAVPTVPRPNTPRAKAPQTPEPAAQDSTPFALPYPTSFPNQRGPSIKPIPAADAQTRSRILAASASTWRRVSSIDPEQSIFSVANFSFSS